MTYALAGNQGRGIACGLASRRTGKDDRFGGTSARPAVRFLTVAARFRLALAVLPALRVEVITLGRKGNILVFSPLVYP